MPGGPIPPDFDPIPPDFYERLAETKKELEIPLTSRLRKSKKQVKAWDEENKNVVLSCWHENEIESDFMWRIYAKEYGFVVFSDVDRLVKSFKGIDATKIGRGFVVYPSRDVLIHDHSILKWEAIQRL
jgi:hypothetical protein